MTNKTELTIPFKSEKIWRHIKTLPKLSEITHEFSKFTGYKNQLHLYTLIMDQIKKETKKMIQLGLAQWFVSIIPATWKVDWENCSWMPAHAKKKKQAW